MAKDYEDNIQNWDTIYQGRRVPPSPSVVGKNRFALSIYSKEGYVSPNEEFIDGSIETAVIAYDKFLNPGNNKFTELRSITHLPATYISHDVPQPSTAGMSAIDYTAYPTPDIETIAIEYQGVSDETSLFRARFNVKFLLNYPFLVKVIIRVNGSIVESWEGSCTVDNGDYITPFRTVTVSDTSTINVSAALLYPDHPYHGLSSYNKDFSISFRKAEDFYVLLSNVSGSFSAIGYTETQNLIYIRDGNNTPITTHTVSSSMTEGEAGEVATSAISSTNFKLGWNFKTNNSIEEKIKNIRVDITAGDFNDEYFVDIPLLQLGMPLNVYGLDLIAATEYLLVDGFVNELEGKKVQVFLRYKEFGSTVYVDDDVVRDVYIYKGRATIRVGNVRDKKLSVEFTIQSPFNADGNYVYSSYTDVSEFISPITYTYVKEANISINNPYNTLSVYSWRDDDILLSTSPALPNEVVVIRFTERVSSTQTNVWEYPDQVLDDNGEWFATVGRSRCVNLTAYISNMNAIKSPIGSILFTLGWERGNTFVPGGQTATCARHGGYGAFEITSTISNLALKYEFAYVLEDDNGTSSLTYSYNTSRRFAIPYVNGSNTSVKLTYSVRAVNENGCSTWTQTRACTLTFNPPFTVDEFGGYLGLKGYCTASPCETGGYLLAEDGSFLGLGLGIEHLLIEKD